jgi:hypothetical protein
LKPLLTIIRLLCAAVENGLREKYEATSDYERQTCAWRILEKYSLPVGAVVTGIEHTDRNAGLIEDIFPPTFTTI